VHPISTRFIQRQSVESISAWCQPLGVEVRLLHPKCVNAGRLCLVVNYHIAATSPTTANANKLHETANRGALSLCQFDQPLNRSVEITRSAGQTHIDGFGMNEVGTQLSRIDAINDHAAYRRNISVIFTMRFWCFGYA
jgi:hypothetical protein